MQSNLLGVDRNTVIYGITTATIMSASKNVITAHTNKLKLALISFRTNKQGCRGRNIDAKYLT